MERLRPRHIRRSRLARARQRCCQRHLRASTDHAAGHVGQSCSERHGCRRDGHEHGHHERDAVAGSGDDHPWQLRSRRLHRRHGDGERQRRRCRATGRVLRRRRCVQQRRHAAVRLVHPERVGSRNGGDPRHPGRLPHLATRRQAGGDGRDCHGSRRQQLLLRGPEPRRRRQDLGGPPRVHGKRTDRGCRQRGRGDRPCHRVPSRRLYPAQPHDDRARVTGDHAAVVGQPASRAAGGRRGRPRSADDGDRGRRGRQCGDRRRLRPGIRRHRLLREPRRNAAPAQRCGRLGADERLRRDQRAARQRCERQRPHASRRHRHPVERLQPGARDRGRHDREHARCQHGRPLLDRQSSASSTTASATSSCSRRVCCRACRATSPARRATFQADQEVAVATFNVENLDARRPAVEVRARSPTSSSTISGRPTS